MRLKAMWTVLAALFALLAAHPAPAASPVVIVDDIGTRVELNAPARRVIALYGAFSEMLYLVGAGDQVIARTQADQFPEAIRTLPSVGTHMRPNVEMIIGLKPDLVIRSATRAEEVPELERIREAGIPVATFAPKDFDAIFSVIERLGVLTGHEDTANKAVSDLKGRLAAVRAHIASGTRAPRVFFEVRADPLTAAGKGSIVEAIIEAAGAVNAIANDKPIVRYDVERLLADQPDFYVVQKGPMNRNPAAPDRRAHFDRVRAVREGRVIEVDEFLFSRPGPRCVDAVEILSRVLYGS